jgi:hypothetical protein
MITIYTAAEAADAMQAKRHEIDTACKSGALFAVDRTPESSRRSWRILEDDLRDWHRRGRPLVPSA